MYRLTFWLMIAFFSSLLIVSSFRNHTKPTQDVDSKSLLMSSKRSISKELQMEQLHQLTSVIKGYLSNDATLESSWEATKTQYRTFYIAILMAIAGLYLQQQLFHRNQWLLWLSVLVIAMMYALDINSENQIVRRAAPANLMNKTLQKLTGFIPNDSSSYSICYEKIDSLQDSLNSVHFKMKLEAAIKPDIDQDVLFLAPLVLISLAGVRHTWIKLEEDKKILLFLVYYRGFCRSGD